MSDGGKGRQEKKVVKRDDDDDAHEVVNFLGACSALGLRCVWPLAKPVELPYHPMPCFAHAIKHSLMSILTKAMDGGERHIGVRGVVTELYMCFVPRIQRSILPHLK